MSVNPKEGERKRVNRFKSSYILFCAYRQVELRRELEARGVHIKSTELTKRVASEWRKMGSAAREPWEAESRKDKARYDVEKAAFIAARRRGTSGDYREKRILKEKDAPKRPTSAYLLYANERRAEMKRQHPDASNGEVSRLLSDKWKLASDEEKSEYLSEAADSQKQYKEELSVWKKTKKTKPGTAATSPPSAGLSTKTVSTVGDKRHYEKKTAGHGSIGSTGAQREEGGQPISSSSTQRVGKNTVRPCESVEGKAQSMTTPTMTSASLMPIGTAGNPEMNQHTGGSWHGPWSPTVDPRVTQLPSAQVVDQLTSSGYGGRYFLPSSAVASVGPHGGGSSLLPDDNTGGSSRLLLPGLLGQQNGDLGSSLPAASFLTAGTMVEEAASSSLGDCPHRRLSQLLGIRRASGFADDTDISSSLPCLSQQQLLQQQVVANELLPVHQQMNHHYSNVLPPTLLHQRPMLPGGGLHHLFGRGETVQGGGAAMITDNDNATVSTLLLRPHSRTNTNHDAQLSMMAASSMGNTHHRGRLNSLFVAPTESGPDADASSRRAEYLVQRLLELEANVNQELAERSSVVAFVLQQQQQEQALQQATAAAAAAAIRRDH